MTKRFYPSRLLLYAVFLLSLAAIAFGYVNEAENNIQNGYYTMLYIVPCFSVILSLFHFSFVRAYKNRILFIIISMITALFVCWGSSHAVSHHYASSYISPADFPKAPIPLIVAAIQGVLSFLYSLLVGRETYTHVRDNNKTIFYIILTSLSIPPVLLGLSAYRYGWRELNLLTPIFPVLLILLSSQLFRFRNKFKSKNVYFIACFFTPFFLYMACMIAVGILYHHPRMLTAIISPVIVYNITLGLIVLLLSAVYHNFIE